MFNLIHKTLFPLSKDLFNLGFEVRKGGFPVLDLSGSDESYRYIVVHKSLPKIEVILVPKSFNYPTIYFSDKTYLFDRVILANGKTYFEAVNSANKNAIYAKAFYPPFDFKSMGDVFV